jgi:hypothetical protein
MNRSIRIVVDEIDALVGRRRFDERARAPQVLESAARGPEPIARRLDSGRGATQPVQCPRARSALISQKR